MADTRKTVVDIEKLETAGAGFANGISTQFHLKSQHSQVMVTKVLS